MSVGCQIGRDRRDADELRGYGAYPIAIAWLGRRIRRLGHRNDIALTNRNDNRKRANV